MRTLHQARATPECWTVPSDFLSKDPLAIGPACNRHMLFYESTPMRTQEPSDLIQAQPGMARSPESAKVVSEMTATPVALKVPRAMQKAAQFITMLKVNPAVIVFVPRGKPKHSPLSRHTWGDTHIAVVSTDTAREVERQTIADQGQIVGIEPFQVAAAASDTGTIELFPAKPFHVDVRIVASSVQAMSDHAVSVNSHEDALTPSTAFVVDDQGARGWIPLTLGAKFKDAPPCQLRSPCVFHCFCLRNHATIVDNSLHFVKNFTRFILKGLATHVYNSRKKRMSDVPNSQLVALRGETVVVMAPRVHMSAEEALVHAAWLVSVASCAMAGPTPSSRVVHDGYVEERFTEILKAVRNT
jgi:hypothetical protein